MTPKKCVVCGLTAPEHGYPGVTAVADHTFSCPVKIPSIHTNGTSKEELMNLNLAAVDAVRKAMEALAAAAPHGRDFYIQDDQDHAGCAYKVAAAEHQVRATSLGAIFDELNVIVEGIYLTNG